MAAAAAPLSTSMLSMSSALKSAMRLTTESCMTEWFPPRLDLVTLKIPEGTETLLTIIPSTTKSGDTEIAALGPRGAAGDDDLFRQLPRQAHPDIRLILWNRDGRAAISRRAHRDV